MSVLTLRALLDLPDVRKWRPEAVTGALGLDTPIGWLHVAEVPDIAVMLRGGEAVLTTGSLWPEADTALADYVSSLRDAGVAALMLALGRRYRAVPDAVLKACRRRGLPLVVFHRPVPFAEVTRAVQAVILHENHDDLVFAQQLSDSFLTLALTEASLEEVLAHTAETAGCPVVLENLANHVLAAAGWDLAPGDLLRDWDRISRQLPVRAPGSVDGVRTDDDWVVTPVGARGVVWGRLVLCGPRLLPDRALRVGDRAASALAVQRLLRPGSDSWESAGAAALLDDLVSGVGGHEGAARDVAIRARAAGFPLAGRVFTPLVLRLGHDRVASSGSATGSATAGSATACSAGAAAGASEAASGTSAMIASSGTEGVSGTDAAVPDAAVAALARTVERVARMHRLSALVAVRGQRTVAALVSGADAATALGPVRLLARGVRARVDPQDGELSIGAGRTCTQLSELPGAFVEAGYVADAAVFTRPEAPFARLSDVHVRGLMAMLRDDERLQGFITRELGPLLAPDAAPLLAVLRVYLSSRRNKAATAQVQHMSRPALYRRLAECERRLGADLDDPERVLSLQVALLALEARMLPS